MVGSVQESVEMKSNNVSRKVRKRDYLSEMFIKAKREAVDE